MYIITSHVDHKIQQKWDGIVMFTTRYNRNGMVHKISRKVYGNSKFRAGAEDAVLKLNKTATSDPLSTACIMVTDPQLSGKVTQS